MSLDATTMTAFPLALWLRGGGPLEPFFEIPGFLKGRHESSTQLVPASEFGRIQLPAQYPIGAIVFPEHVPDRPSELTVVSASEAHEEVCESRVNLVGEEPPDTFTTLAGLVRRVPTFRISTNALDEASQLLEEHLTSSGVITDNVLSR